MGFLFLVLIMGRMWMVLVGRVLVEEGRESRR